MTASVLMIQGTMSDVGKSVFTAALCRLLARRGVRVAPFKPQNMALNSAVTVDGGEIGRAQAMQAAACGLEPHTDMNPILLKPNSDRGSQVIIQGRAMGNMDARAFHAYKDRLRGPVMDSFRRLTATYQVVLVEGAGSPAEINLRERDIANMGFASMADCPVLLVGDIDRGGVFAQLVGTMSLLPPDEAERVRGLVINKFRGDLSLLTPGLDWLAQKTGKPVLGVMPFLPGLLVEAEDSFFDRHRGSQQGRGFRVVVPRLPRLSNHTDLDPLAMHPAVDLCWVETGETMPPADLVILPGSKSVRADLHWLEANGWRPYLQRHVRYGGRVVGICGGFQMLGHRVRDPHGLEGEAGEAAGFGLLDLETVITPHKHLVRNQGRLVLDDAPVVGYEIHMGVSSGPALQHPALVLQEGPHGAVSDQVLGCYLHGLFDQPAACGALLHWAGLAACQAPDVAGLRQQAMERLADAVEQHMDLALLSALLPGLAITRPASG